MSTTLRVNEEEFDEPGERAYQESDQREFYHGVPFTGVGILEYGKGRLRSECTYKDGFLEGRCRQWHPNGQLEKEWFPVHGLADGRVTSWHENGKVAEIMDCDSGVVLHRQTFDAQGKLVDEYKIDESSLLYKQLQAAGLDGKKAS